VYSVTPQHKVRIGYNRAFKSPTILENYLYIGQVALGNRNGFTVRDADGEILATIDPLEPEEVNAVEIGYKGTLGRRVFIDAVVHNSWYRNFISPLTRVADPTMGTFGYRSDGTIVAQGAPNEGTLSTYMNFGEAQVRGADIGASLYPVDHVSVSASASLLSLASFSKDDELLRDLLLNVPGLKLKGSVALEGLGMDSYFVRLSGRFHTAYEFESGYWRSETFFPDGKVPSRFVLDVSAGYDIPRLGVTARAFLLNALGNTTVDVLGAPTPERLFYLQLEYTYPGLAF
jgi:iron complex outermembrane receptor protein